MRCFVISLRHSAERRRRLRPLLDACGVDYHFFEAIDLNRDRNRYFHHCDERRFQVHTGRTPTTGELGCFASHLMLWRTCRLLDEPLVILEDDLRPRADFGDALELVGRLVRQLGFIRLQDHRDCLRQPVVDDGQRQLGYCLRYPHGSAAYAISPRVADAFIRRSRVFHAPVDVFIKRFWAHAQPLYALSPAPVTTGTAGLRSTIPGRDRPRRGIRVSWRRRLQRCRDFIARAGFNARQRRRLAPRPLTGSHRAAIADWLRRLLAAVAGACASPADALGAQRR